MKQPILSILCAVYNHEQYLRDCLNGFVMQKTDFQFEAIVHDDASTDKSAEIIREYAEKYPNIIKPIFESENQYSKQDGSLSRIMNETMSHSSKYVAICEGDDYWTDPNKLQKQVDFLESHPEFGMVYSRANIFLQKNQSMVGIWGEEITFEKILLGRSPVPTLTACLRKDIYIKSCEERTKEPKWILGDVPLWIYFLYNSKIHFIQDITGVYRKLEESSSNSKDFYKHTNFVNGAFLCRQYYAKKYIGKDMAKRVAKVRINYLLDMSLHNDKPLKQSLLKELLHYKIYDLKLFTLIIVSHLKIGRFIIKKERELRTR